MLPKPPDYESEVGDIKPLSRPDIEIELRPSRESVVAGEPWSVTGEISNHAAQPIWIVDTTTRLHPASEVWGSGPRVGSLGAFFPTIMSRPEAEVVRIDPGASYSVIWRIDASKASSEGSPLSLIRQVGWIVRNFAFFKPGIFATSAIVHVWCSPPKFSAEGVVSNLGESFTVTVPGQITVEPSPWVLVLGAAIGGILCYLLQLLYGIYNPTGSILSQFASITAGLLASSLLPGSLTVILSRLASTEFLVAIKIRDLWGALTIGFIVQWFGYGLIDRVLSGITR